LVLSPNAAVIFRKPYQKYTQFHVCNFVSESISEEKKKLIFSKEKIFFHEKISI